MISEGDKIYYEEGCALKGEKIAYSCRKHISGGLTKGSHSHRAQTGKLDGGAYCIIEKKFRQIPSAK